MYEVYLERHAERDLRRLSKENFQRIIARIQALADNPRPSECRKIVGSQNDWRIRVGEYRILYEIDDKRRAVRVMRVLHRREAYRLTFSSDLEQTRETRVKPLGSRQNF